MDSKHLNIILAEDDADDRLFFETALKDFPYETSITFVNNGQHLMELLHDITELPHVLVVDFNMPRKNGFECLQEIKSNRDLKNIPVIIYSTSYQIQIVNLLFQNGAHFFIQKTGDFFAFKKAIQYAITYTQKNAAQPKRKDFMLIARNDTVRSKD
ncbi:MAG: response regulator [Bacteroidetes bacterium]|nr:response regulator [Bacteroidota bacterium]